jgi:hypothetical protein
MSKGVEVYVVSPWPRYGGGRMNQLMLQVDGGGSRLCGVEGESLVEVWRGGKVLVACGARPFCKRARPFCKRARPFARRARSSPSRRFGDFLLFFHAAKS